jgi:hypothetical protein
MQHGITSRTRGSLSSGCEVVYLTVEFIESQVTFWSYMSCSSSGIKIEPSKELI